MRVGVASLGGASGDNRDPPFSRKRPNPDRQSFPIRACSRQSWVQRAAADGRPSCERQWGERELRGGLRTSCSYSYSYSLPCRDTLARQVWGRWGGRTTIGGWMGVFKPLCCVNKR